jgi:hypothetical protein
LLVAVLRDVGDAGVADLGDGATREVVALERDASARRRPQPDDRLRELALTVPLDAGDAEDLARADLEGQPVQLASRCR